MAVPQYIVPIDNHKDLVRDIKSKGIINRDSGALATAKQQKQYFTDMHNQLVKTKTELDALKFQVQEIYQILEHRKAFGV